MKKTVLLIMILILNIEIKSQTKDDIYFIFTSVDKAFPGCVSKQYLNLKDFSDRYRDQPLSFTLSFLNNRRVAEYWHFYRIKPILNATVVDERDQHQIIEKPIIFLDSIVPYDWEVIKNYTYQQWDLITEKYLNRRNVSVYMIDRRDIKDGILKLIQVMDMRTPRY